MRSFLIKQARGDDDAEAQAIDAYANLLLLIGNGDPQVTPTFTVPPSMCAPTFNHEHLFSTVFGDLAGDPNARSKANLCSRAILTPKNDDVDMLNAYACSIFPGEPFVYKSADTIDAADDNTNLYPTEFLNSLNPSGMANHSLTLKVGMPIMLLRNLNTALGLANGTRLIVVHCGSRLLQAEVMVGAHAGKQVLLPRISLTPSDGNMPFKFIRRQFPIRPAFALTINKSQGQTLLRVGIFLPRSVFSHGQLYVAMSRVGSPDSITLMVPDDYKLDGWARVDNVVYVEALQN
jgi:hypothetical protein